MKHIADNELFNAILLCTIIGEFLLPCLLERYYPDYNRKTMVMSALGSPQSPVRLVYNIWLIWLGGFLTFTAFVYFEKAKEGSPVLSFLLLLSIGIFAIGAGVISGLFSVNDSKSVVTVASKIHGVSAAIGFMTLLFFPLLQGIIAFASNDLLQGIICIISFLLAVLFFVFFIMGDKERFRNTILSYEGLWERLCLFFMYVPFFYGAIKNIT